MATDELRTITAHHEAGHAVAAVMRGGSTLTSVTLHEDGRTGITWHRSKLFDAGFIAYAGQWAEATYAEQQGILPGGGSARQYLSLKLDEARDDMEWGEASDLDHDHDFVAVLAELDQADQDAAESLASIPDEGVPPAMREAIERRARVGGAAVLRQSWEHQLEREWPAVQQVAAWLLDGRTVTDADVRAVVCREQS